MLFENLVPRDLIILLTDPLAVFACFLQLLVQLRDGSGVHLAADDGLTFDWRARPPNYDRPAASR